MGYLGYSDDPTETTAEWVGRQIRWNETFGHRRLLWGYEQQRIFEKHDI